MSPHAHTCHAYTHRGTHVCTHTHHTPSFLHTSTAMAKVITVASTTIDPQTVRTIIIVFPYGSSILSAVAEVEPGENSVHMDADQSEYVYT